jgi:polyhydroxyalkanoate synthesis regulator phasin
MATKRKREPEQGLVERLAERGEEAVSRLLDELNRSPRVADALDKAMSAKGRVDSASRSALSQIGVAAADEIKDLRGQLERLEKRLARLEGGSASGAKSAPTQTAKRSETKKTPTAKKRAARVKTDAEKAPSPPPGRAIGGGTGRGSPGGTGPSD